MKLSLKELQSLFNSSSIIQNGKNLKITCPKCGQSECYISIVNENHPGRCWRENKCGYSFNIYTVLKELGRLEEFSSDYISYKEELNNVLELSSTDLEVQSKGFTRCNLPVGFKFIKKSLYLDLREFDEEDYNLFLPGITNLVSRYKDSIIFPIFENYEVVGYITRSIHTKEFCLENGLLRYQKSDSDFYSIIYGLNYEQTIENVIVVEGLFDLHKVRKCVEKYKLNYFVFPLLGVSLSQVQIYKLKRQGCKNLTFLLDRDIEHKLRKSSSELLYDFNCYITFCDEKDPGDSSIEEIYRILEEKITLEEFLLNTVTINLNNE